MAVLAEIAPLSVWTVVTEWQLDPATALLSLAAVGLYAFGVRRLAGRGRRWPPARSAAFATGVLVLVVATQSGLAAYDTVLFSAHVGQHLLLGMVAPMLLALGAPITLALQASRRETQRGLLWLLRRRPARWLAHPVTGWALFGGSLFVLYFTPLFEQSLRNDAVHVLVHVHFVVVGSLFFWPILAVDPVPTRLPAPARVASVFLAVPFHAVLGISLLVTDTLLADGFYRAVAPTWAAGALTDQRTGAGILWAGGDLLGVAATLAVAVRWMAADDRAASRADRADQAGQPIPSRSEGGFAPHEAVESGEGGQV